MKKCPYCAEEIQDEAVICRYCQKDLRADANANITPDPTKTEETAPTKSSGSGCASGVLILGFVITGINIFMGLANFQNGGERLLQAYFADSTTTLGYITGFVLIVLGFVLRKPSN